MSKFIVTVCFALFVLPSHSLIASPQKEQPVVIEATFDAVEGEANRFSLVVTLEIQQGWHVYGIDNEDSPTTIELELPDGVKQIGDWDQPVSEPYGDSGDTTVYKDVAQFSCDVEVGETSDSQFTIVVDYQACTDKFCNRPKSETLTVEIPKLADAKTAFESAIFESPVRLMKDGKPIAHRASFPSPAIYDVDGDGADELLVGSLRGTIDVFENVNESKDGDPVWGDRVNLEDSAGKKIKVTNW